MNLKKNAGRYVMAMCVLILSLSVAMVSAETLNPENVNPHADASRKRITQEQKKAAAAARKLKKQEIAAKKAAARSVKPITLHPEDHGSESRP